MSSSTTTLPTPVPQHFTFLDENFKLSKNKSSNNSSSISRSRSSSFIKNRCTSTTSDTHRRCAFTRKCARLVKEQRARFYIMRRCVTMLVCWRDYGDS